MERRRLDAGARRVARRRVALVHLRGPPRILAPRPGGGRPLPELPGARPPPRAARAPPGLHAHRAAPRHGAPLLWLLGVPDHRLLHADRALRRARGPHVSHRPPPPAWDRRDPRLGPFALPGRRAWPRVLRWDAPVRARRP